MQINADIAESGLKLNRYKKIELSKFMNWAALKNWELPKELAGRAALLVVPDEANVATTSPALEPQAASMATVCASGDLETDKVEPAWSLKTSIERLPGYRWQTYQALQDAHIAGQPCPKAQHLLDIWKLTPPNGLKVIQSSGRDELEYELETCTKKLATVRQIQAAIKNLLSK